MKGGFLDKGYGLIHNDGVKWDKNVIFKLQC